MFKISLNNNKSFLCDEHSTIFDSAKLNDLVLDHSCLSARCRSCIAKVIVGKTLEIQKNLVLSSEEKKNNFILTCNSKPLSDLKLDIEDLESLNYFEKKIIPAKINSIENINYNVIKLVLRLPPNSKFEYNSGQYVNIIKGNIKRSYSVANNNNSNKNELSFFIKNYENGIMSDYLFNKAKKNDLLRIEGPIGTFFFRESKLNNIIFLATGTGIAPVKSIIENIIENKTKYYDKKLWIFHGGRYKNDLFWKPPFNDDELNFKFIPVLSRNDDNWIGEKGYVQDVLLQKKINLKDSQVYACGSDQMIESAKNILCQNGLEESNFFSDAFVKSN